MGIVCEELYLMAEALGMECKAYKGKGDHDGEIVCIMIAIPEAFTKKKE